MTKLAEAIQAKKGNDSLRSVAGKIGVAPGTLEGWLKGWRKPKYENLRPLATYLEEDIDMIVQWLVEDDETRGGLNEAPITHVPSRRPIQDFRQVRRSSFQFAA